MSIILGIDPGSRKTGFGVIRSVGREHEYLDCGFVRLGDKPLPERLDVLFNSLQEIISRHQPDYMAVEQVFLAKNAQAALTLGHARGTAIVVGMQNSLQVDEYSAKQIKRAVVGTGAAAKEQVQHMVKLLLNLPATPQEDAADALAAAICHAHHLQNPLTKNAGVSRTVRSKRQRLQEVNT